MAELADGFVALPGGFGTLDETLEILTWNQLGLSRSRSCSSTSTASSSRSSTFLDGATEAALLRPAHRMLAQRARTVDEVIALGLSARPRAPGTSGSIATPPRVDQRRRSRSVG